MFRIMAALAFAVSFDLCLYNGKYMDAVWQMAIVILQHLNLI